MNIFKKANFGETPCPICKGKEEAPVTLIPIVGTVEGHNVQALMVHVKCIGEGMVYYPKHNSIIIDCGHG